MEESFSWDVWGRNNTNIIFHCTLINIVIIKVTAQFKNGTHDHELNALGTRPNFCLLCNTSSAKSTQRSSHGGSKSMTEDQARFPCSFHLPKFHPNVFIILRLCSAEHNPLSEFLKTEKLKKPNFFFVEGWARHKNSYLAHK